jgi:outer membrane protein TolC
MFMVPVPAMSEVDQVASDVPGLLQFDASLNLHQVVEATYASYPQQAIIDAMQQESQALEQRSDSWLPGYSQIYLQNNQNVAGDGEGMTQTGYQIPLWRWGQRDVSRNVTDKAIQSSESFAHAVRLEVAGMLRERLWQMKLAENRLAFASSIYEVSTQLVRTVKRRVELGDLAPQDLLLAESDSLEKKTGLTQAELDLQHAHQAYANLSRLNRAPVHIEEELHTVKSVPEDHPALFALNAMVERAQADVSFTREWKQGAQPTLLIGTQHRNFYTKGTQNDSNVVIQIPLGGDDYNAPFVAQANLTLNQRITERNTLARDLERRFNQAEQSLAADRKALDIAQRRREIAETQIRLNRLAFEAGEIHMIDFLKVQSAAQASIWDATLREIIMQRDIAAYHQVIGRVP